MTKITYKDVKESYTEVKAKTDIVCHPWYYILRPISFKIAAILANAGISPTFVTIAGILLNFVAAYILIWGQINIWAYFWGGILINIWGLLDCIDGDMARALNKKSKVGGLLDSFSGQLHHGLTPLAIAGSFYIGNTAATIPFYPTSWPKYYLITIAGIEVFTGMLRTLISFKAKLSFEYQSGAKPDKISFASLILRAPINFRAPLFMLAFPLGLLFPYLLLYMLYNVATCIGVLVNCVKSANKYDQNAL
jgi:phosphatidylglycerophosphate synthase